MRVKNYLFDESPFENSLEMESDFVSQLCVPFCHRKLESDKIRHHTHVTGEYSNGVEVKYYEAGQYIDT